MADNFIEIKDMEGYIRSRQEKGMTIVEIRDHLMSIGCDLYAAQGLLMKYWGGEDG
jgi:hypothetical protein